MTGVGYQGGLSRESGSRADKTVKCHVRLYFSFHRK